MAVDGKNKVGGTIFVKVDGRTLRVRGDWSMQPGDVKRDGVVGSDGVHGYVEKPQLPYLEGDVTIGAEDMKALRSITNATITCQYGAGRVGVLREAWYAGEGVENLTEGSSTVRFEGKSWDQVR